MTYRPAALLPTEMFISVMNTLAPWSGWPDGVVTRPEITALCACARADAVPATLRSTTAAHHSPRRDGASEFIMEPRLGCGFPSDDRAGRPDAGRHVCGDLASALIP